MKQKQRRLLTLFLLLSGAIAAQENRLSVKECADYAKKNSVQVKNALLDIQIQEQVNKEITSLAYPQLSGSFSLNDFLEIPTNLLPGEVFGQPGTRIPVKFGTKYNATGGFDLTQILFDGQVFVGLQARDAVVSLARKNAEVTEESIKANIYKVYYQLVVAKKQTGVLDANIERFEKLLHDTKEIFKNGFVEKLDVDKVTVQLNNLNTEKLKLENMIQAGNSALKFLMNMPQRETLVLTDTLSDKEIKTNILDSAFNYNDRKEIQLLSIAQKLGEYNIRRYKLSHIPTVVAFASYSKNAQRQQFDLFGKGDWFTTSLIGLKIQVPIFDGFAKKSRIAKAKLELQKTNNNIDLLKQAIDTDVEQSRIKMKSAILTMDAQKRNIELAEKVYNTTKLKYEQGLGSNQEIYNAQAELKVAQTNYFGAVYDAISAKIDWLKATGKL